MESLSGAEIITVTDLKRIVFGSSGPIAWENPPKKIFTIHNFKQ